MSDYSQSDTAATENRRTFLAGIAGAVPIALAGCSGSENQSPTPTSTMETQTATESPDTGPQEPFTVEEATIGEIHTAMSAGELTARDLVETYESRIEQYDSDINSIITVNPDAQSRATELDETLDQDGFAGPLHGIPVVLKDNYDTKDLQTTAGSKALEGSVPPNDAFVVEQLREAGAIILAKANMHEFAYATTTVSSLGGQTHNPYDPDLVPGGSSGGSAAAAAANLGAVTLGTDTGSSIRDPATYCNLVGLRPTVGLTSRDGIVPMSETQDVGGPITRTVSDTARLLDVIAGYDPSDPATAQSVGQIPTAEQTGDGELSGGYTDQLNEDALANARIGVLREFFYQDGDSALVSEKTDTAVSDLEAQGADVVTLEDTEFTPFPSTRIWELEWERDLDEYLATLGGDTPSSTEEVIETGQVIDSVEGGLRSATDVDTESLEDNKEYLDDLYQMEKMRQQVLTLMADHELDALVYPSRTYPAEEIGASPTEPAGSPDSLAPLTGFPAITVPAGFVDNCPVGIEFLGRAFSEPSLLGFAYAYEQATEHRTPPSQFSSLNASE